VSDIMSQQRACERCDYVNSAKQLRVSARRRTFIYVSKRLNTPCLKK